MKALAGLGLSRTAPVSKVPPSAAHIRITAPARPLTGTLVQLFAL
ncbi:MAG: hypothetical protein JWQ72_2913, partial [Polaromonas sp.]|nr:hypothetical protein [Polaromonas sp.]